MSEERQDMYEPWPRRARDYKIELFYSEEDEGFIANVPGIEYCSAHGDTPEDALREIKVALVAMLETMDDTNKSKRLAPDKAVEIVRKSLNKIRADYPLFEKTSVEIKFVKQDGEWACVSVIPKKWPKKHLYGFYEMLSKVESEVEDQGLGNILLVTHV